MIWNARGSAYKNLEDVTNKIQKLNTQHPYRYYEILEYRLYKGDNTNHKNENNDYHTFLLILTLLYYLLLIVISLMR